MIIIGLVTKMAQSDEPMFMGLNWVGHFDHNLDTVRSFSSLKEAKAHLATLEGNLPNKAKVYLVVGQNIMEAA